jgi:hypothetical protein
MEKDVNSADWKDARKYPGVVYRRIDTNYYAIGKWKDGKIIEVDFLDRRNRGSRGTAGNPYRSETTGIEALWDGHLKRIRDSQY